MFNQAQESNNNRRSGAQGQSRAFPKKLYKSDFEEKVVKIKRISKTTKGGRQSRA